jgi:5'-3' exonuclease
MNKYNTIILDGHNLFWQSWYINTVECLLSGEKIYTGGIGIFIERIKKLRNDFLYKEGKLYILFDNPESALNVRRYIDPNYKSHRLNNKYAKQINKSISYLKEVLRSYFDNSFFVMVDGYEADDIVPLILPIGESNILLVSTDLDWARNINENIHWYNYKLIYTPDIFFNHYGFYPGGTGIKYFKSFKGDDSDNIPNAVPYLPKDVLSYILNTYNGSLREIIKSIQGDSKISLDWRKAIKENENRILKNYTLVDFIIPNVKIQDYIQACNQNKVLARVWFKILSLELETWMMNKKELSDFFMETKRVQKGRKVKDKPTLTNKKLKGILET